MERLQGQGSNKGERALNSARSMLSRYCAAQMDQKFKIESTEGEGEQTKNDDSTKFVCPSVPLTQVSPVISSYDEAISKLLKSGQKELAAQAMSELGDVMWHSGHCKSAGRWWREVLSTVTGGREDLPGGSAEGNWRKLTNSSQEERGGEATCISRFGVWGCLLAAVNATKLARLALYITSKPVVMKLL